MICAGNWKLNKNLEESKAFVAELLGKASADEQSRLVLLPQALTLNAVIESARGSRLKVGAQNCFSEISGAFTGENSAATLASMGAASCLVGHSERRQIFQEGDEFLAKKVRVLQDQKLIPIFCIGETLQERENGQTEKILERQLQLGLSEVLDSCPLWIAYEPVWAIGTGKVASLEQVKETHAFIRRWLDRAGLKEVPILYGGSVKPDNSGQLSRQPHVDGFLIGGASLEVESFLGILRSAEKSN